MVTCGEVRDESEVSTCHARRPPAGRDLFDLDFLYVARIFDPLRLCRFVAKEQGYNVGGDDALFA